jgi:hypothetical protein
VQVLGVDGSQDEAVDADAVGAEGGGESVGEPDQAGLAAEYPGAS